ncbi:DAK2 domain-containing protein [Paenibacillus aurantius]|uniref:DAK2 domain-containing protein n=1 Tax=Paenibacillus aurantius TaxID=2918900 RepID=A0AA96RJV1_9BACL|nr:DAK2 domain-containing protein [Paenibacillus aurantius]WNQ13679.1 DAK2 domain-containing protein [Paenibacillus aurantius]
MSKRFNTINGSDFVRMMLSGADHLRRNVNNVNALNVFPVPDGDTGTNMNLTMTSGVEELRKKQNDHIGRSAEALSKGLLMGARGNSGVILSQLFRGFAKSVQPHAEITPQQLAAALQQGVDTAYQAVVKPVEGTILTVAKEAAKHALYYSRRSGDVLELMKEVLAHGQQALARTPEQLPVLKQVGVVDAGGQGLICVYEGMVAALSGNEEPLAIPATPVAEVNLAREAHAGHEHRNAQSMLATEDIEQGYCTEFLVKLVPGKVKGYEFRETEFRGELSKLGDSLLVVADDDLVKIHIHAEHPGEVMTYAQNYGELTRIKIENMREQHTHIVQTNEYDPRHAAPGLAENKEAASETAHAAAEKAQPEQELAPYGFVGVSMGSGIEEIFASLGVDVVISGGQTMNPSTEDIVNAVREVPARTIFVLPNNSNIIMAAKQAKDLVEDKQVVVIPTKTIPQGMAALVSFQEQADPETNEQTMLRAVSQIRSGQVTYAVRDTSIDGLDIKEGDYIGLSEGKIVTSETVLEESCTRLLEAMLAGGGEIVTILTGENASEDQTASLLTWLKEHHPEVDVEVHPGGQPLYVYIFSVE